MMSPQVRPGWANETENGNTKMNTKMNRRAETVTKMNTKMIRKAKTVTKMNTKMNKQARGFYAWLLFFANHVNRKHFDS